MTGRRERAADLPVVAERIDHTTDPPPVRFFHRDNLPGTCRNRPRDHRIRILHCQDHPDRAATQRFRAEVVVGGGLVSEPKLRTSNRQPRHDAAAGIFHPIDLGRPECGLVEFDGSGAVADRQHGRDRVAACAHARVRASRHAHTASPALNPTMMASLTNRRDRSITSKTWGTVMTANRMPVVNTYTFIAAAPCS